MHSAQSALTKRGSTAGGSAWGRDMAARLTAGADKATVWQVWHSVQVFPCGSMQDVACVAVS